MDWNIQHKNHCKTLWKTNKIEIQGKPSPRSRQPLDKSLVSMEQFLSGSLFLNLEAKFLRSCLRLSFRKLYTGTTIYQVLSD